MADLKCHWHCTAVFKACFPLKSYVHDSLHSLSSLVFTGLLLVTFVSKKLFFPCNLGPVIGVLQIN